MCFVNVIVLCADYEVLGLSDTFRFKCSECGEKLEAAYEDAGRKGACWNCEARFVITPPDDENYNVNCPECSAELEVSTLHTGRKAACWRCEARFQIPPPVVEEAPEEITEDPQIEPEPDVEEVEEEPR